MLHAEDIIRVYRNGDTKERMDTYLSHPGLRGRFDEIEREESRKIPLGDVANGKNRSWRLRRPFAVGRRTSRS